MCFPQDKNLRSLSNLNFREFEMLFLDPSIYVDADIRQTHKLKAIFELHVVVISFV